MSPAEHIAIAERIVAEVNEHATKIGQQQAQDLALAQSHALLAIAKQNEARSSGEHFDFVLRIVGRDALGSTLRAGVVPVRIMVLVQWAYLFGCSAASPVQPNPFGIRMTDLTPREQALVKEAYAVVLAELNLRVPPGSQDSWRGSWHGGIEQEDAEAVRAVVRSMPGMDTARRRLAGTASPLAGA